jgi:hypothetical protein
MRRTGGNASTNGRPYCTLTAVPVLGVVFTLVLAGCTLEFESPALNVTVQSAYPTRHALVPYEVRGASAGAITRWTLRRYLADLGTWETDDSWTTEAPGGGSAILRLEHLEDGRYQLSGELLASRGGKAMTASTLTSQSEFYIATDAPRDAIDLSDNQGGYPYDENSALEVYPTYSGEVDTDTESPVELYYVLDSTEPPTADDEPAGATIEMWDGSLTSYSRALSIVAIDQAGNVGTRRVEIYIAP